MAGTIPLEQLFLNKFVAFNLDRYENDPEMLPLFQNLQLADISITGLVPGVPEAQTATVSSTARNFSGIEQAWLPAFLASVLPFDLLNPGAPLADLTALDDQTVPGVYGYLDADGTTLLPGLVLPADTDVDSREANAKATFQDAFKYVIADGELTVDGDSLDITMNAYVRGSIVHVVAAIPVITIPPTDYGRLEWPTGE